jgi:hypothetical protein
MLDLRFPHCGLSKALSSGTHYRVVKQKFNDVLEKHIASIFRVEK